MTWTSCKFCSNAQNFNAQKEFSLSSWSPVGFRNNNLNNKKMKMFDQIRSMSGENLHLTFRACLELSQGRGPEHTSGVLAWCLPRCVKLFVLMRIDDFDRRVIYTCDTRNRRNAMRGTRHIRATRHFAASTASWIISGGCMVA